MEATPEPRCKKFCSILSSRAQGYNDGLQATEPIAEGVMPRVVSPQNAKAANPEKLNLIAIPRTMPPRRLLGFRPSKRFGKRFGLV
eukprot:853596-Pelagomonas_calceolata.AAC.2